MFHLSSFFSLKYPTFFINIHLVSLLFWLIHLLFFCFYWLSFSVIIELFIYAYGAKLQIPTCYLIFSGIVQFFCLPEKKMSTCPRKNLLTMKKAHAYFIILMTDFYKSHRIGCILMIDWNTLTWCNSRKVAQSPVVADPLTMRMGIADWWSKTWTPMRVWKIVVNTACFKTVCNHMTSFSKYS